MPDTQCATYTPEELEQLFEEIKNEFVVAEVGEDVDTYRRGKMVKTMIELLCSLGYHRAIRIYADL